MGLGLLGRGVGDAAFLARCGAQLLITDLKTSAQLKSSLDALAAFPEIQYSLGGHKKEEFRNRDLIIKAAGVPEDSVYLAVAKIDGTPIRMSTDLFIELSGLPCIGVTGTRGKTTVTCMIDTILKEAGVPTLLGGNIPYMSTLAQLPESSPSNVAVLELDSWQLQGFGESHRSPHIAVFTTFFEDHLGYYKGNMMRYLHDKAQIFLHQSLHDTLIVGNQAAPYIAQQYPNAFKRSIVVSETDVDHYTLRIPGIHNKYNAACARAAAQAYGIDEITIKRALESFTGVPGRLELVREQSGIRVYNDTTAIIPEATYAALEALAGESITLIIGGDNKGNHTQMLIERINAETNHVICIPGTGSTQIAPHIHHARMCDSLYEAVAEALRVTPQGGVILFSPVFSSWSEFTDVYDRGEQFIKALNTLWTP